MTAVEKRMDRNDSLVGAPSGKCMIPDSFSKWQRIEYAPVKTKQLEFSFYICSLYLGLYILEHNFDYPQQAS